MDRKTYFVYCLTSPSGRSYVGFTGQAVAERWRQHVNRAMSGAKHPLCSAIRKYGADSFKVEVLFTSFDEDETLAAEVHFIAQAVNAYNLSPGGENDGAHGNEVHQKMMREDPEYRARYIASLSEGIRKSHAHRKSWDKIKERFAEWRKANPKQAYKNARRALRLAMKAERAPNNGGEWTEQRRLETGARFRDFWENASPSKKKAMSIKSRRAARKLWAERTPEQFDAVTASIADGMRRFNANTTEEEQAARLNQLAEARKSIDHDHRKARQKEGLAAYWTPERRAEFSAKQKAMAAAKRDAKNANV